MRIWILTAASLITLSTAHEQDDVSDIEKQAINDMVGCYQAHQIHELVARMDEDRFVRTVMVEVCTEQRRHAAGTLADTLASKGISKDEIPVRVESFLLGHTTFLRMFYRRIKGAQ
jgi:hypothetical protein